MNIAILGGGNAGYAAVADLTLQGHRVNMFEHPNFRKNIEPVLKRGGIQVTGEIFGLAKPHKATTNIEDAVKGVDIVIIMVPAYGQKPMAEICAPHLENGQIVILDPGATGGALEFHKILEEKGIERDISIGETTTLPYGCRVIEPALVKLKRIRNRRFAAFPGKDTQRLIGVYKRLYPTTVPAINVLEVGLNNNNPVIHPAGAICNAGRIEYVYTQKKGTFYVTGEDFYLYKEGMTPSVTRIAEAVDRERMAICGAFGYTQTPSSFNEETLYDWFHSDDLLGPMNPSYAGPFSLRDRHIEEDVGFGLVTFASIGGLVGVPTPTMKALIHVASVLTKVDYWGEGRRKIDRLGIDGMSIDEINQYLKTGERA